MGMLSILRGALTGPPVRPGLATKGTADVVLPSQVGAVSGFPSPQLFGYGGYAGSNTGQPVTPIGAMQASAVYACVKVLSEDVGKVPVKLKRRLARGGSVVDTDHPLNALLRRPNGWQTPFDYHGYCVTALLLRGNAFSVVKRGSASMPIALIPIQPDRCGVMISPRGELFYSISHPQLGDGLMVHQDDVVHARNISIDGGYLGVSAIGLAQDSIGITLAAQQHGATLFRNGVQAGGVIEVTGRLSKEAGARLGEAFDARYAGVGNAHKTLVLEEGAKFNKLTMTPEDAQLLATRQYGVIEICRIFRTPPHKVMDLTDAHYSNMEQATNEYIEDGVEPIAIRFRQHLEDVLLFEDERDRFFLEHDYAVLQRGDTKTRYEAHAIALTNGFKCADEVRAEEGLNPIPGGDVYRAPLNTGIAGGDPQTTRPADAHDAAPAVPQRDGADPAAAQPIENAGGV